MRSLINKLKFKIKNLNYISEYSNNQIFFSNPLKWKKPKNKILIVGTHSGRSGLRWLANVHASNEKTYNLSEPFPVMESFFRYSTFNKLNIDHSGFFSLIQQNLEKLWKKYDCVFYASPWLSFGIDEVIENLNPDYFVTIIRNPREVVSSLDYKGWYKSKSFNFSKNKITGLQPFYNKHHHLFSRVAPSGGLFNQWNELTSIGKAAWYWVESNKKILEDFNKIDKKQVLKFRLEEIDQNYLWYTNYANFFKFKKIINERNFYNLKKNTININRKKNKIRKWSDIEENEFNQFINPFNKIYSSYKSTF